MSPENTYKLMGFYMEVLILGVILWYMFSELFHIYRVYRVKLLPLFIVCEPSFRYQFMNSLAQASNKVHC